MRLPILTSAFILCAIVTPSFAEDPRSPPPPRVVLRPLDGADLVTPELTFSERGVRPSGGTDPGEIPYGSILEAVLEGVLPQAPPKTRTSLTSTTGPVPVEVELVHGDSVRGTLERGEGEMGFVVGNIAIGQVTVDLESVVTLRFPIPWDREDAPPSLTSSPESDVFYLSGGDRLEGTLRSIEASHIRVRTAGGVDRDLPTDSVVAVVLAPLPPVPEKGIRVQVLLRDGSRLSGSSLSGSTSTGVTLKAAMGGQDRTVAVRQFLGFTVRGGDAVSLSSLTPSAVDVRSFWPDGASELLPRPAMDRAVSLLPGTPPPLVVGGAIYGRGLSMYSGTSVTWNLPENGWSTFRAAVGVDDAAPRGVVLFEVLVDGISVWKSGPVGVIPPGGAPAVVPPVKLAGARTLTLRVHAGPGDDVQDCADWVRAVLVR